MLGTSLPLLGEHLLALDALSSLPKPVIKQRQPLHLFTKVLQWAPLADLPGMVQDMGFVGIDIAVRSNGHFTVEELKDKLPRLVAGSKQLGMNVPILTTELTGDNLQEMEKFLQVLSGEGVRHYRLGWLKYTSPNVQEELKAYNSRFKKLADLHAQYGVQGHYQNHAGSGVGGSVWELLFLLEGIDPQHIGVQYDLRHAVVEGYRSWENGFQVIKNRITTIDVKDFKWQESNGKDVPVTVPLGKGNVDFSKLISSRPFQSPDVPKILHVEYSLGGAEHGNKNPSLAPKAIIEEIRKDVEYYGQEFRTS